MVDPNVLVSGAISSAGAPRQILLAWGSGAFELIVSQELLHELESVLMREKFRKYLTQDEVIEYILWLREGATVAREGEIRSVSEDPDDDYLLALVAASRADHLVSGDPHLLDLPGEIARVVSPRAFLDLLERNPHRW